MSVVETRRHQMFPVLDMAQIETPKRFASGEARSFAPDEVVFDVGERSAPAWLVLEGSIDVVGRDGLNREVAITTHRAGQISGELRQLTGRATLAMGRAGPEGCTALPFDSTHLRALVVGSAEVGETIMRAFILRRVGLIQEVASDQSWSVEQARRILSGFRGFSAATSIPTPSWTPRRTRKVAPSSSAWACSQRSCR